MTNFNTVSVIGLGYIGLPTAAVFASRKVKVIGVDVNLNAVEKINRGEIHIVEPDLDIVVRSTVSEGWLKATATPEPAEAFLIAVPTPFKGDNRLLQVISSFWNRPRRSARRRRWRSGWPRPVLI